METCESYDHPLSNGAAVLFTRAEGWYKTHRDPSCSAHPTHLMSALNSTILNSVAGEDNQLVAGAVCTAAILATTAVYYAFGSKDEGHDFPKLRGIQLYHAWNFFQRRFDFLHSNFKRNSRRSFSFNVLHHNVVALTGEDARRAFFSSPHLSFYQGYKILMGAVRTSLPLPTTDQFIDPDRISHHRLAM